MTKYTRPGIAGFFDFLGVVSFLIGGIAFISAMAGSNTSTGFLASTCILSGFLCIAIGAVIGYLARAAFHTERIADLLAGETNPQLKRIEDRLAAPLRIVPQAPKVEYFYSLNGTQEGPFSRSEMRSFCKDGIITENTNVFRTGDKEWLPFEKFQDLMRN
jgi:hypothetical protein